MVMAGTVQHKDGVKPAAPKQQGFLNGSGVKELGK